MQNPNAVVSTVIRIEPPLDRPAAEMLRAEGRLSVELEEGRRASLDVEDPRAAGFAQVLQGLSEQHLPVYLELDPQTSGIKRLLIPYVAHVVSIRPIDRGVLAVELAPSHARHVLRRGAPDFDELERQVRVALQTGTPVMVTEDDSHEIIDVRGYRPDPERPPLRPFPRPEFPPRLPWPRRWIVVLWRLRRWRWWPWWWFHCISSAKAQQVFDAMNATSCAPLTVPVPCIPFLYPDDGCWGRAHEMCRLMVNIGLKPKKVWIQGGLHVSTKNNPSCEVYWGWHVAPTLCVRGPAWFQTRDLVIDPSLFTAPVAQSTWKGVQGDPGATLTDSDASIFYLWGAITDPNYTQTNQVLATYRLQLQNRAIQQGPPPYANCA